MTLVEVVPVHLVDSHGEYLFVVGVDSFPDEAAVDEFVDVDACGVAVVEDEGVAEGLRLDVEGLLTAKNLEKLFVKSVGFKKVYSDCLFEGWVAFGQQGLAAKRLVHRLELLKVGGHKSY